MSTVVAQPYSTAGNGGRKLVKWLDGTTFAIVKSSTSWHLYKTTNDWVSSSLIYSDNQQSTQDACIQTDGKYIYVLAGTGNVAVNLTVVNGLTGLQVGGQQYLLGEYQTAIGNVSLAINQQGTELHAAWASKNSSYPNSFNIRYAKGTINGDGSVTWGAAQQVTMYSSAGTDMKNPSIVHNGANAVIVYDLVAGSQSSIQIVKNSLELSRKDFTLSGWSRENVYEGKTYTQSSPSAVVDKNGVIHVAWQGTDSTDNVASNISYAKSLDGGVTWSTSKLTIGNVEHQRFPSITVDKDNNIFIMWSGQHLGSSWYHLKQLANIRGGWGSATILDSPTLSAFNILNPSTLYDSTFSGAFNTTPPTIYQHHASNIQGDVRYIGTYTTNQEPIISITSPTTNQTLYENDVLYIDGTASEADIGDSVTIRYQINAGTVRAIKAFVASGVAEAFSKTLTFRGGSLYDGETLIASGLTDGVAHTLKVYATDDKGGQSPIVERAFYVVPNRAPSLTVNPPVISGLIDSDEIEFTGSYVEPDGNQATVSYRINGGGSVQIAQGVSGDFDFKIKFGQLKVGLNNVVVEVIDSYGAKTSRTVKLQKDEVAVQQLKSTARYRIKPPLGTATGVVVWVQRDTGLTLDASISMTQTGEAENFVAMEKKKTAPVPNQTGIVEDQFQFENATAVDNIILQLDMEKSALGANEKIHTITGVVE